MRILHHLVTLILLAAAAPAAAETTLAPGQPLTERLVVDQVRLALGPEVEGRLRIEIDRPVLPLNNRSGAETLIRIREVERDARTGRFRGVVRGSVDGGGSFALPLSGRAIELVEVPVLIHRVERGEPIAAADLEWREVLRARLPRGAVLDLADLAGSEARRNLTPGRALTGRDVGPPILVRRGRPVRLIYSLNGLTITALGTAQDDGARDTLVRVTNADSRRQVQGLVTGPDEVTLSMAPLAE